MDNFLIKLILYQLLKMFPRSLLIVKNIKYNASIIAYNNFEREFLLRINGIHNKFCLSSFHSLQFKCKNITMRKHPTMDNTSFLSLLLFSSSSDDSKISDSKNTNTTDVGNKITPVALSPNLQNNLVHEKTVIKEMDMKSGTRLVVEAKAASDSTITDITFKKENVTTKPAEPPKVVKRLRVDLTASSLERNFITPVRAMSDYLLKPTDLESLPKIKRRSPYELEPPITVYWLRDVEAKSNEIWGNNENLKKEHIRRDMELRRYHQNVFTVKRRLRDFRRELGNPQKKEEAEGLSGRSGRVVLTAVAINGCNFVFKLVAWLYTGSHSMFSESIHSLADTINQLILAYGIHKSGQIADSNHPYGYTNMRYVASLISGVGIFCVGTGLSYYHGVTGLLNPQPMDSFYWAYVILGGALISEGATLLVAINAIKKGAKEAKVSFKDYVIRGSDPSINVVLLEDMAAVGGVAVAAGFMGLSSITGNPQWDACGSLFVGTILGCVASFIILSNVGALVGRSIPQEQLDHINADLEADVMVRAIHDVKGIDMGSNCVRYKAELDFDGRQLTRSYLDKQDLNSLLEEVKKLGTLDELEGFMLKHGENIVDMMGGEIDRIELKLRKSFPHLRHCDLEIL